MKFFGFFRLGLPELFSRLFCVAASRLNSPRLHLCLYAVRNTAVKHEAQSGKERGQAHLPDPEIMKASHSTQCGCLGVGKAGLPPLLVFGVPKLDSESVFWLNAKVSQRSSLQFTRTVQSAFAVVRNAALALPKRSTKAF